MDPRPAAASPLNLLDAVSGDGRSGKIFEIQRCLDVDQEESD
jgi:hypothetical protein